MNYDGYFPFEELPLPYDIEALKPYISEYTLYFHHDKHYRNYLDKLNGMLKESPLMQNVPLEALTKTADEDMRTNAGGVYSHELYFSSLTPLYKEPSPELKKLINAAFGSEKEMWGEIIAAGLGLKGSGYVWLVVNPEGKLEIITTKNQETPDFDKYKPLLAIDVWEHAYYLDRQNLREAYLNGLKNIINWDNVQKMLDETK